MVEIKKDAKKKALYVSLGYVGLGTLSLFAMLSEALSHYDWAGYIVPIISLITMPVCFLALEYYTDMHGQLL